jgi:hypothetical protein
MKPSQRDQGGHCGRFGVREDASAPIGPRSSSRTEKETESPRRSFPFDDGEPISVHIHGRHHTQAGNNKKPPPA